DPCHRQRVPGGADAEAGGVLVVGGDPSLADAGPRHDPLVRRVDHGRQLLVGHHARWRIHPPSGDDGVRRHRCSSFHRQRGSISTSGCWRLTSVPRSTRTRTTLPATSDLISLNSFIASISPTTAPVPISSPSCTYGRAPGDGEAYQTPVSGAVTKRIPAAGSPNGLSGPAGASPAGVPAPEAGAGAAAARGRARRTTSSPASTSSSSSPLASNP